MSTDSNTEKDTTGNTANQGGDVDEGGDTLVQGVEVDVREGGDSDVRGNDIAGPGGDVFNEDEEVCNLQGKVLEEAHEDEDPISIDVPTSVTNA